MVEEGKSVEECSDAVGDLAGAVPPPSTLPRSPSPGRHWHALTGSMTIFWDVLLGFHPDAMGAAAGEPLRPRSRERDDSSEWASDNRTGGVASCCVAC